MIGSSASILENPKISSTSVKGLKSTLATNVEQSADPAQAFLAMLQNPLLANADASTVGIDPKQLLEMSRAQSKQMGTDALLNAASDKKVLLSQSQLEKLLASKNALPDKNIITAKTAARPLFYEHVDHPGLTQLSKNKQVALKEYVKNADKDRFLQDKFNAKLTDASLNDVKLGALDGKEQSSLMSNSLHSHRADGITSHQPTLNNLAETLAQRIENSHLYKLTPLQSEVKLEVEHGELGHISFNVKKHAKELEIQVHAKHLETQQLLADHKDALISQLTGRGLSISDISFEGSPGRLMDEGAKTQMGSKDSGSSYSQQYADQGSDPQTQQQQSEREKRNELWEILRQQQELSHA